MMQTAPEPMSLRLRIFLTGMVLVGSFAPMLVGIEQAMALMAAFAAVCQLLPDGTPQAHQSSNNPLVLRLCMFVAFASMAASFRIG